MAEKIRLAITGATGSVGGAVLDICARFPEIFEITALAARRDAKKLAELGRRHGAMFLLTLFFCTWCCDVAAYFTGSHFGRTPLCSQVSPHKTWEGFAGGAAASLMCGGLLALIFSFPPLPLLLLGLLCGVAGQLGDLGESVLKREAGVKDTGNIIPGHGGMLDRFDSILVNGTLAFVIFELVG